MQTVLFGNVTRLYDIYNTYDFKWHWFYDIIYCMYCVDPISYCTYSLAPPCWIKLRIICLALDAS
jgi:hypothetical protein